MTHADDLRAWARGTYTTEAATELLLRAFGGRFAAPGNPWVHAKTTTPEGYTEGPWIDFESIPGEVGVLSGGERRFLLLAASLAENVPVVLGDLVAGLDRENLDLVLAAIAHAGGSHQHSDVRLNDDGSMSLGKGYLDSLHPWPRLLRAVQ
ncbi:ABC transporter ATP-binding protein [Paenarthrobacter sp. NEAU-H11]|uniref:ATP-binding cassette domain-containing protein n=1 Tax=Paenarthrobacter sp. NEAU-H11 TaxID=3423924 RepID=UPI003D34A60F